MKNNVIISSAIIASAISYSSSANIDLNIYYQPQPPWLWDKLLDLGQSWVRKQGKKSEDGSSSVYTGTKPTISAYMNAYGVWTPYACTQSEADNSGVWINELTSKTISKSSSSSFSGSNIPFTEYTIGAGTPYEIESKNYRRAGAKRFAKFYYSFRIDNSYNSTVIDNHNANEYKTTHTFKEGENWLYSSTLSDYELFIGVKASQADFNYPESWANNWGWRTVSASISGNYYLSDCGFAKVISERNTRPEIGNVDISSAMAGRYDIDSPTPVLVGRDYSLPNLYDKHTKADSLNITWNYIRESGATGKSYGRKAFIADFAGFTKYPAGLFNDPVKSIQVIVTDGGLSATLKKEVQTSNPFPRKPI